MKDTKRIHVKVILDPDLHEWVVREAERHRSSIAQVIREAVASEIERRKSATKASAE